MKKIKIYKNDTELSKKTEQLLLSKIGNYDIEVSEKLTNDCDLLVCIGGDGAFLEAMQLYQFPKVPVIGINTGHLGFFQEISIDEIDVFLDNLFSGSYQIQTFNLVEATITFEDDSESVLYGVNEIVIKGRNTTAIHLSISIGDKFIERCSGDGILVATAAGSTAYNYALGGAIVDPRIKLLQVTPIAPMNTTAYRSFTSSILLPSDLPLGVVPEDMRDDIIYIINDGISHACSGVKKVDVRFSEKTVRLLRFEHYYFWDKVKSKFL